MNKRKNNKKPKINRIFGLLNEHYCFTQEEIDQYKSNTLKMKDEGLDAFIKFLEEAKNKQDELLSKKIKEDSSFTKNFIDIVKKTTKKIKKDYELEEKKQAKEILTIIEKL